jgi:hypothetical protein
MRKISSAFADAVSSRNPKFFLLGKIEFADEPLLLSSLNFQVTFKGDVYPKGSPVISFGPPRVSSSVDRQIYELIIADTENYLQDRLREGVIGVTLSVYIGFFSSLDGHPLLEEEDVVLAYRGVLDSGAIVIGSDSKLCKVLAASPMGKLDAIGAYMVSKDGMDQINENDTSFDEVIAGSKEVNLKWGKRE